MNKEWVDSFKFHEPCVVPHTVKYWVGVIVEVNNIWVKEVYGTSQSKKMIEHKMIVAFFATTPGIVYDTWGLIIDDFLHRRFVSIDLSEHDV